jgi:hypothetical protein
MSNRVVLLLVAVIVAAVVLLAWLDWSDQTALQQTPDAPARIPSSPIPTELDSATNDALDFTSRELPRSESDAPENASAEPRPHSITLIGKLRDLTQPPAMPEPPLPAVTLTFLNGDQELHVDAPDGQVYRVEGLSPGRVRITARVDGFRLLDEEHQLRASPLEQRLNLYFSPLSSMWIRLVTPDGVDLGDALAAQPGAPWQPRIAIVTTRDAPGRNIELVNDTAMMRYEGATLVTLFGQGVSHVFIYRGLFRLPDPLPLHVSACRSSSVLCSQPVNVAGAEITLTVSLDALRATNGSVHFRVVDARTGMPLDTARAELTERQTNPRLIAQPYPTPPRRDFRFDDIPRVGGDVHLADCEPGVYRIEVAALDHEHVSERVTVEPGGVTELGTYRLMPAALIEGIVRDESGAPISRAHIEARPLDADAAAKEGTFHECSSDWRGHFELHLVGRRKYFVRAMTGKGTASIDVDTSGGSVNDVALTLRPGVQVKLKISSDDSVYSISIFDSRHFVIAEKALAADHWTLSLPPGAYSFEVEHARVESALTTGTFEVGSSPLEVQLPE